MSLNRAWITQHIPHQGSMCLLDEVLEWDALHARCRSTTHRAADHPMRAHGRLGVVCGIEYAAQTMAVHGALVAAAGSEAGLLASLREVSLYVERLDDIPSDLICEVIQLAMDRSTALYEFLVSAEHGALLRGRAVVLFDAKLRLGA